MKEKEKYWFSLDQKVVIWHRTNFGVIADSYEEARLKAIQLCKEDNVELSPDYDVDIVDWNYNALPYGCTITTPDDIQIIDNTVTQELWSNEFNKEVDEAYDTDVIWTNEPIHIMRNEKINNILDERE